MKTHRTDIVSLIAGMFFLLVVLVGYSPWLGFEIDDTRWIWPTGLIVLGLVVLVSSGRRRDANELPMAHETGATTVEEDGW